MKNRSIPMRRCAGCNESKPKEELLRISAYQGKLTVDLSFTAPGRGVYLCKDKKCLESAIKRKAFNRSLKQAVDNEELSKMISEKVFNEQ